MRLLFALSLVWSASAQFQLVSNTKGCDYNSPVEVYLKDGSATRPTLKACQDSCLSSPICLSVTYYFDKFCSHFASSCENLRVQRRGAQTFSRIPTTTTAAHTATTTTPSVCYWQVADCRGPVLNTLDLPAKGTKADCAEFCHHQEGAGCCRFDRIAGKCFAHPVHGVQPGSGDESAILTECNFPTSTTTPTTPEGGVTTGTTKCIVKPGVHSTLDVAFVVDMTSSMWSIRDAVVSQIIAIATSLKDKGLDIRVAFIAYRDQHNDIHTKSHFEILDFTEDIPTFKAFVNGVSATGGGDFPEDVAGGLEKANLLHWQHQTRVMFLIADAPGHVKHNDNAIAQLRKLRTDQKMSAMNFVRINHFTDVRINRLADDMIKTFNDGLVGFNIQIKTLPLPRAGGTVDPAIFTETITESIKCATTPGFVQGVVFGDTNKNGKHDSGEPLREGVGVKVIDSESKTHHLKTDRMGSFEQQVPPGDATVHIEGSDKTVNVPSGGSVAIPDVASPPVDCSTLGKIQINDFECGDVITTTTRPPVLRQIAVGKKCSAKGQTSYMPKSSQTQPTLNKCMESCQANVACMGFTYFADRFCSQFSVMCDKPDKDAPFSVSYKYDAPRAKPMTKFTWSPVAPSKACKKEEVEYIAATSGTQETAQQCKVACEASSTCVAVTFWLDHWCSHYSKFCTTRTEFGRGVSSYVLVSRSRRHLRG